LRAVEAKEGDKGTVDLWRGMKNLETKAKFLTEGGTENALMSTTTNLKTAVEYSLSKSALLFKLATKSCLDRGAE